MKVYITGTKALKGGEFQLTSINIKDIDDLTNEILRFRNKYSKYFSNRNRSDKSPEQIFSQTKNSDRVLIDEFINEDRIWIGSLLTNRLKLYIGE